LKLLETHLLTVRFGGLTALCDVDLIIEKGKVVGIIGPNGSGKTTLFNIISGIYRPSSGSIVYKEKSLVGLKPWQISKEGIARTFQSCRLFGNLTVLENVLLGRQRKYGTGITDLLSFRNMSRKTLAGDTADALEIMRQFGSDLVVNRNTVVSSLNHSTRRRIEICRALMAEPELLLLDEPAAGMDAKETESLLEDILKIKQGAKGITVAIIEHDMGVIKGICDHVVALNNGEKIAEGSFADLARNKLVRQAYLGLEDSHAAVG